LAAALHLGVAAEQIVFPEFTYLGMPMRPHSVAKRFVSGAAAWLGVITALGYGFRYLTARGPRWRTSATPRSASISPTWRQCRWSAGRSPVPACRRGRSSWSWSRSPSRSR
jgi:hypothetical protein